MYVRQKKNKSGVISVQVIRKDYGRSKLLKTIGSSVEAEQISKLVVQGRQWIKSQQGIIELDFVNHKQATEIVLENHCCPLKNNREATKHLSD